jgi:hypothetical protein
MEDWNPYGREPHLELADKQQRHHTHSTVLPNGIKVYLSHWLTERTAEHSLKIWVDASSKNDHDKNAKNP